MPEGGGGGGAGAGVARGGGGDTPKVTPVEFDDTGPPNSVTGTCLLPTLQSVRFKNLHSYLDLRSCHDPIGQQGI